MLYGKILYCPHPRARLIKIETSKAAELPGVEAILTFQNTKGWRTYWYNVPQIAFPECITYEGQEIAAVAAETVEAACKAIDLIEVAYEVLTPRLVLEEALRLPPPDLVADEEYPQSDLFDRKTYAIRRGDVDKGFAEADIVIENTYTTPIQYHGTVQTRICLAQWDGQDLTIWDSTQGVWNTRESLARSLDLDPQHVRVIVEYLGGGFGSKAFAQRISYYAARLSMETGRPVRIERTRREEFLVHPRRYDCRAYLKIGAKRDGTLTAIEQRAAVNLGAASRYLPNNIIWHTSNLYACSNVLLEQTGVYTNVQITGLQRAPLNMPAIFFLETHIDRIAEAVGMDPLDLRLKNLATHASTPINEAFLPSSPVLKQEVQIPYSSGSLDRCIKLVAKAIGWNRRASRTEPRGSVRRGIGLACFLAQQGNGLPPYKAYADIEIRQDGTITLFLGVVEIGGGQKTIFPMIAAEELGVRAQDVKIVCGDTFGTRYAPSCQASRCTPELGPAVLQAAAECRAKLFDIAASLLQADGQELRSRDRRIFVKSDPDRSIDFSRACREIDPDNPIRGAGSRAPNPDYPTFATFGAQAVEVEVDLETGQVQILKVAAAQDFGRAINPKLCVSQVQGGVAFGIGYALLEEGVIDPQTGKLLNGSFLQYRIPSALEIPAMEVFLVDSEDPYFAYSAKGAGENSNTPTAAAICNAIHDATGVWLNDLPMTPDRILGAFAANKTGGA